MMESINTARYLRKIGCYVPDHIPDKAIIPEDGIEYLYTEQQFICSPYVVPFLTGMRLDMTKFTWEPYRRPTNTRLLVSRNKREGRYLGWRKLGPMKRGESWAGGKKPGHQRMGREPMVTPLSVKAIQRDDSVSGSGLAAFSCWG